VLPVKEGGTWSGLLASNDWIVVPHAGTHSISLPVSVSPLLEAAVDSDDVEPAPLDVVLVCVAFELVGPPEPVVVAGLVVSVLGSFDVEALLVDPVVDESDETPVLEVLVDVATALLVALLPVS
jgi:hypothetical protein